MATDLNPAVNGGYNGQPYGGPDHPGPLAPQSNTTSNANGGSGSTQPTGANGAGTRSTPSKDEVGWYFVEQYYTTLSRSPEKLHLFYSKRSQFVSGEEAEKVSVAVGQRAIADRIKELDIQDCKVRVTNVDSQESSRNIVVQVIGEISNKSAPQRKFVQTFILAEQPNGYYVLNDIFRYITDEEEDDTEDAAPAAGVQMPEPEAEETATKQEVPVEEVADVQELDKKLEEAAKDPEPAAVATPDTEDAPAEEESSAEPTPEPEAKALETAQEASEEAATEPDAPKEPQTTAVSSPKPTQDAAAPPPPAQEAPAATKPALPKTWANILGGSKTPIPAVPQIPAASPAPAQPKAAPQPAPTPVSTAPASTEEALASPGGWQTAGQEHNRKQGRQQAGAAAGGADKGNVSAYIKGVVEKVDAASLKQALSKHGKLDYFDVSRQKNCAFVEFADAAGYQAAVAANPHLVNGIEIYVEERLRNGTGYGGFNPRGGMRGGRGRGGLDGRSPSQTGRGGFNKDARGGFGGRGRGNLAQRGRGAPQAA